MQKTLLLTGGSSGIGFAIAEVFANAAYKVINLDIQAPEGQHTRPENIEFICCDITDYSKTKELIGQLATKHTLDVVISNAGMHLSANIENTSMEDFDRLFELNVKAAFNLVRTSIAFMKAKNNSVVLFIGSDQSIIAKENSFAYNLSKHALASMAKTIALDYARYNIRSNLICPGTIETPLYHKAIEQYCHKSGADLQSVHKEEAAMQPLNRIGQAEDVAQLALFLASDKASFITGSMYPIDGGYTAG